MQIAIRAAIFSLMTTFVSCGVGAHDLDTDAQHTGQHSTLVSITPGQ